VCLVWFFPEALQSCVVLALMCFAEQRVQRVTRLLLK
jgi:hypothetical protein